MNVAQRQSLKIGIAVSLGVLQRFGSGSGRRERRRKRRALRAHHGHRSVTVRRSVISHLVLEVRQVGITHPGRLPDHRLRRWSIVRIASRLDGNWGFHLLTGLSGAVFQKRDRLITPEPGRVKDVSSIVGDLLDAFVERLSAVDIGDEISAHRVRRLLRLGAALFLASRGDLRDPGQRGPSVDVVDSIQIAATVHPPQLGSKKLGVNVVRQELQRPGTAAHVVRIAWSELPRAPDEESALAPTLGCALTSTGEVTCWGDPCLVQLGQASTFSTPLPIPTDGPFPAAEVQGLPQATDIAVSGSFACATTGQVERNRHQRWPGQVSAGTTATTISVNDFTLIVK